MLSSCKRHCGLNEQRTYDKEGFINKSSGLHGRGALTERDLDD